MLAKIICKDGVAVLTDKYVWKSANKKAAKILNQLAPPEPDHVSAPHAGYSQAKRAARLTGGRLVFAKPAPLPRGCIA